MERLHKYHKDCCQPTNEEVQEYTLSFNETLPMLYKALKELQEENTKLKAKFDDFHKFLILNDKIPPPPPIEPEPIKTMMIQPVPIKPVPVLVKPVLTREKKMIDLRF